MDDFLRDLESAGTEESTGFTIDPERQLKISRQALAEGTSYFCCHLLAAANVQNCPELRVTATVSHGWRTTTASYKFELVDYSISREEFEQLGEALTDRTARSLQRLSLGLHQAEFFSSGNVSGSVCLDGVCHRFLWKNGAPVLLSGVSEEGIGLTVELKNCAVDSRVSEWLIKAAPWVGVSISWNGRRFSPNLFSNLRDSVYFRDPDAPIPWPTSPTDVTEGGSCVGFTWTGFSFMTVVALWDGVPLEPVTIHQDSWDGKFIHALTLVLNGKNCHPDGSYRQLARSLSFDRELAERVERVASELKISSEHGWLVGESRYHFQDGYKPTFGMSTFAGGRGLFGASFRRVTSVFFEGDAEVVRHRSYKGEFVSAISHPTKTWSSLRHKDRVEIWDERQQQLLHRLQIEDVWLTAFDTSGLSLFIFTENPDGSLVHLFCLERLELLDSAEVECPRFGFDHYNTLPGPSIFVRGAGAEQLSILFREGEQLKSKELDNSGAARLTALSPNGDYLLLSDFGGKNDLLNLSTGRRVKLQRPFSNFIDDGRYLVGGNYTEVFFAPTEAPSQIVIKKVPLNYSLSSSGVLRFHKSRCGKYLNSRLDQDADDHHYLEKTTVTTVANVEKLLPKFKVPPEDEVIIDKNDGVIRRLIGGKWRTVLEPIEPNACLTSDFFAWESSTGVTTVCRKTGNKCAWPGHKLKKRLLLSFEKKSATFRLLDGTQTARLKYAEDMDFWEKNDPNTPIVMSVVSPDFGCAIISAKTGQRLCFSRLGRYLETPNWILSVRVVGMVGSSQVVARRKGRFALWKRLGNIQNVVAHPSEDVVFFVDQWGALQRVELVRDRTIGGSLSGPKLAVSQSGRYVACSTWFGVSIYDGSTCELLSCIEARGVFVGDDSDWGDSYDELRWIGDDYLWSHSSVWWATDSRDWRKPQLLEGLRIQEDFVSDANGLVVEISEGELIFYDLPNRKVLGTLHILGKDWFCFTPAGLWDSSLDSPTGVRPEPVAADRVSGLLETFVTRDPDN